MAANRSLTLFAACSALALLSSACGKGQAVLGEHGGSSKLSREPIPPQDDPGQILPGASRRLFDNISWSDVGYLFGVADANVPYPDTYWPFSSGGVDWNWTGYGSPLAKYMYVTQSWLSQNARGWEYGLHGPGVPGMQDWWGHCPGWTAAAMLNPPLRHGVDAAANGSGGVAACAPGTAGCLHFEIGDLNALMAEVHVDADSSFLGGRCDVSPNNIQRDPYGRIQNSGTGCRGVNPGALLVVLGQRMRGQGLPIAIDAQGPFTTNQIWNQPAYRYGVYRFQPLTESQAANLVALGTADGPYTNYLWNNAARGFAFLDVGIQWVSEYGPNTSPVSGLQSTNETRMVAVIELDSSPNDGNANIIGGEYLDDPSAGADRLSVAPFIWIANGPGPESPSGQGDGHNPYVSPSVVRQLVSMAY